MANWIKAQNDLAEDPRIQGIAARLPSKLPLPLRETIAVGGCIRVWSHFDRQSTDGFIPHLVRESIDSIAAVPGFGAAMEAVGWLEVREDGLLIPRFEKHNSETAKQRALEAARAAKYRRNGGSGDRGGGGKKRDGHRDGVRDGVRDESPTEDVRALESERSPESLYSVTLPPASTTRTTKRDSQRPPDEERWRRAELLAELQQLEPGGRSEGFFRRVVIECRIPTIERALAITKAAKAEQGLGNTGAYFTRVVIDEAAKDGTDLKGPRRARSPSTPSRLAAAGGAR